MLYRGEDLSNITSHMGDEKPSFFDSGCFHKFQKLVKAFAIVSLTLMLWYILIAVAYYASGAVS